MRDGTANRVRAFSAILSGAGFFRIRELKAYVLPNSQSSKDEGRAFSSILHKLSDNSTGCTQRVSFHLLRRT